MATDTAVDAINILRLRNAQKPRQCSFALSSRYHALPSIRTVRIRNGMVNTRNAGAMAAPVDAVPNVPRTAGITHHQGSGKIGAITRSSDFSITERFSIWTPQDKRYPFPAFGSLRRTFGHT